MRISNVLAIATFLGLPLSANAQETFTPPFGGSGGQQFIARCPPNTFVTGVAARTGAYVNYVAPLCDGRAVRGGAAAVTSGVRRVLPARWSGRWR